MVEAASGNGHRHPCADPPSPLFRGGLNMEAGNALVGYLRNMLVYFPVMSVYVQVTTKPGKGVTCICHVIEYTTQNKY